MTRIGIGFALLAFGLAVGCGTGQSNADTANAAASSTPPAVGSQTAADTNALNTSGVSSTSRTATTVKRGGSSTKVSGKSDSRTQQPVGRDTILGYDSVIKFPLKTLPTATSTPRK
jgi:hypothetical protein